MQFFFCSFNPLVSKFSLLFSFVLSKYLVVMIYETFPLTVYIPLESTLLCFIGSFFCLTVSLKDDPIIKTKWNSTYCYYMKIRTKIN